MVVLKEMLKHAVQWGYLDANPAQYAERPRGEDQEMQILTPPEIRRLLDAVRGGSSGAGQACPSTREPPA